MTLRRRLLLALSTALAATSTAAAADLDVPGQFATIQAAVDVAAPGDRIRIADGEYDELVVLQNKSDLVLKGDDDVRVRQMEVRDCLQLSIKELTFTGAQGVAEHQLRIEESIGVDVRLCSFEGGFVGFSASSCEEVTLRDSTITPTSVGFLVLQSDDCRISATVKKAPGGNHVASSSKITVEESKLVLADLAVFSSDLTTIRDNQLKRCGLSIHGSSQALIEGNRFKKGVGPANGPAAMNLTDTDASTILSNTSKKATFDGLALDAASDGNLLLDNALKKSGDNGIRVGGVANTIAGNRIKKSGNFDLFVNDPNANAIGDNLLGNKNF